MRAERVRPDARASNSRLGVTGAHPRRLSAARGVLPGRAPVSTAVRRPSRSGVGRRQPMKETSDIVLRRPHALCRPVRRARRDGSTRPDCRVDRHADPVGRDDRRRRSPSSSSTSSSPAAPRPEHARGDRLVGFLHRDPRSPSAAGSGGGTAPAGGRVLHRLRRREVALGRQPVRLHHPAVGLRRAARAAPAGAAHRGRRRARAPRRLHRARRADDRQLRVDLPALRRDPRSRTAVKVGRDACAAPTTAIDVERLRSVRGDPPLLPRHRRVRRHEPDGPAGRTPCAHALALVAVAILGTDIVFAIDSVPAVYGITGDPYLVFATNAFALLGLRALYFVLEGALAKLVHLGHGLRSSSPSSASSSSCTGRTACGRASRRSPRCSRWASSSASSPSSR